MIRKLLIVAAAGVSLAAVLLWPTTASACKACHHETGPMDDAALELRAGNDAIALEHLAEVASNDDARPLALLESARILYRAARWSEFFGVSRFVRTVYPKSAAAEKARRLETLALLRHCQFGRAKSAYRELKAPVPAALVTAMAALPEAPPGEKAGDPKSAAGAGPMKKLDPYRLREPVESLCGARGKATARRLAPAALDKVEKGLLRSELPGAAKRGHVHRTQPG